ncbi:MAG: phage tail family protein [Deltaproteobacteria bacterium]|nr:phage tail family protein [Deltaproteobacteria bacterium]
MVDNGGFKIGGIAASTYGVTLMYAPGQPMLPDTRDREIDILGRSGQYWTDSDAGIRMFSLPCMFDGSADAAALETLIRAFAVIFVDEDGRSKLLDLEFDDAPGLIYSVRYAGQIPFDRAWIGCSEFTLNLIADDPYAYQVDEEYDYESITTSPGTMTVTSDGNVSTPAILCVENTGGASITGGFSVKIQYEVD